MSKKMISVVIPSYNEEKSVREMYDRLVAVFRDSLPAYDYEIIFVDDYSTDQTRPLIRQLASEDPRVKAIFNARNFGFHRNVFSALSYGRGDATFMLFGDLQDPPENLPEFVRRWESGRKVVVGQRRSSDEGWLMTFSRFLYYKLIDWFADSSQIARFTGYGLYDREFVDILKDIGDIQPFFKAVVSEYGIDLDIVQYIAALVGVVCLGIAIFVFVNKIVNWNNYGVGEASTAIGIFFLGSIQLFFIGILGEYILSINGRITRKPRVVVGERINFADESHGNAQRGDERE